MTIKKKKREKKEKTEKKKKKETSTLGIRDTRDNRRGRHRDGQVSKLLETAAVIAAALPCRTHSAIPIKDDNGCDCGRINTECSWPIVIPWLHSISVILVFFWGGGGGARWTRIDSIVL